MGAWSYEVLSNDRALDTMWDLVDSKNLKEDIIKDIDERCFEYEEKNSFTREENIGILNSLEEKYN